MPASTTTPPASPLTAALVAFHQSVSTIHETSKAQYGTYADLATVLAEILPKLAANGIRLSQYFKPWGEDGQGTILVTSLKHVSGEEEISELPLIRANSSRGNPLHDWGGAVTYQRRYAILSILGLAAGIPDDDGDSFDQAKSPSTTKKAAAVPSANGKAAPAPAPSPAVEMASTDQLDGIRRAMVALKPDTRSAVVDAFRKRFGTPEGQGIADYIKTTEHIDFLTKTMNANVSAN